MTSSGLPPLISSDGHLEVRPERWTPRMPAKHRERAPRTIKLPDGGDALLVEGQPPYPAPFLDLRAGRTNETWEPFGVTVDDTAGVGPPEQRLREQDMDALHAEVLFPNMQVGKSTSACRASMSCSRKRCSGGPTPAVSSTVTPKGSQVSLVLPALRSRNGAGYGGWPSTRIASPPSGSLIVRGAFSRSFAGMCGVHRSGRTSRWPSLEIRGGRPA